MTDVANIWLPMTIDELAATLSNLISEHPEPLEIIPDDEGDLIIRTTS